MQHTLFLSVNPMLQRAAKKNLPLATGKLPRGEPDGARADLGVTFEGHCRLARREVGRPPSTLRGVSRKTQRRRNVPAPAPGPGLGVAQLGGAAWCRPVRVVDVHKT